MTKYLLLIDSDNPADVQVFTPQDAVADAQALTPAAPANRPVEAAVATAPRRVAKAKVARTKTPAAVPEGGWVGVRDAATQLGVSPAAVHYQIKTGGLVSRKTEDNLRLVTQESIDAFRARSEPDQSGA